MCVYIMDVCAFDTCVCMCLMVHLVHVCLCGACMCTWCITLHIYLVVHVVDMFGAGCAPCVHCNKNMKKKFVTVKNYLLEYIPLFYFIINLFYRLS